MTNSKENYAISKGLKEYIVEFLNVTAKGHSFKGERVMAGSKMEAFNLCKRMTKTGRVLEAGQVFSNLRVIVNADSLKSDRGCRVF